MRPNSAGYFYLLNTVALFSTYEAVSKTLVGRVDPFQVNFVRFFVGGMVLFFFVLARGEFLIGKKDFFRVFLLGATNVALSMNFLQLSLCIPDSKASVVAVIFSSNPIFVSIFSAVFEREKINLYRYIGLAVGFLGILTISLEKTTGGVSDLRSPLMALLSAILYGLYTVEGRKVSVKIGSLKMNAYSFILGSLSLLPFMLIYKIPVFYMKPSAIPHMAYLSVFVTGLAYLTYFKGLALVGAGNGSLVFFLKPVLASFIAVLFLGEKATPNLFIGTMMVLVGIASVIYWPKIREKFLGYLQDFKNN